MGRSLLCFLTTNINDGLVSSDVRNDCPRFPDKLFFAKKRHLTIKRVIIQKETPASGVLGLETFYQVGIKARRGESLGSRQQVNYLPK